MVKKLRKSGHLSTFEHASFTFGVEGVSRVLTHQLVRHRLASYSQKSQRYVKESQFDYVLPEDFNDKEFITESGTIINGEKFFKDKMETMQMWYKQALERGIKAEDARFLLPNACETKIMITMNARELIHFFEHRCCTRAQWEIRSLANEMMALVKTVAPNIFKNTGPACINGDCPEGSLSCGNATAMKIKYKP